MKNNSIIRQYHRRMIVSGKVLEIYHYEKPVAKGFDIHRTGRANANATTQEIKDENRKKVAQRARATVRRMVNANPQLNKFLTLTYAENMTDINIARYDFDKFIKRLKTRYKKLQYIVVPEFQKRGAIHFHLLCNLPFINAKDLEKIWSKGFIRINRIDNVDNVGAYVTKYMSKDNLDDRLIGKKCYSMSKDLNISQEITKQEEIEEIETTLENVKRIYTAEFDSDYYGKVTYTQIICTEIIKPPKRRKYNVRNYIQEKRNKERIGESPLALGQLAIAF